MKKYQKWLFPVLTITCMLVTFFFPIFFIPALIVGSLCFAVSIAINKSAVIPLVAVFAFIGLLVITGSIAQALFLVMTFVPIGTALGMTYRRKDTINSAIMLALLLTGFMMLLLFCSYIMEASTSFSVKDALEPFKKNLTDITNKIYYEISIRANTYSNANLIQTTLAGGREGFANRIFTGLIYQMPIILSILTMGITFINYFWVKRLLKGLQMDTSFMSNFDNLRISRVGAVIYVVALLFYFMLNVSPGSTASLVFMIFVTVQEKALGFSGLSLIDYILKQRTNFTTVVRRCIVIIILLISVVLSVPFTFIALLGTLDAYYDIRKRFDGGDVL